mmetsp:Transcript_19618/g.58343  ORF Transcript_19618/g.58343 Transcript_19618/m.58343 type:complete len:303 (+) Transcript_19618:16-924(+)
MANYSLVLPRIRVRPARERVERVHAARLHEVRGRVQLVQFPLLARARLRALGDDGLRLGAVLRDGLLHRRRELLAPGPPLLLDELLVRDFQLLVAELARVRQQLREVAVDPLRRLGRGRAVVLDLVVDVAEAGGDVAGAVSQALDGVGPIPSRRVEEKVRGRRRVEPLLRGLEPRLVAVRDAAAEHARHQVVDRGEALDEHDVREVQQGVPGALGTIRALPPRDVVDAELVQELGDARRAPGLDPPLRRSAHGRVFQEHVFAPRRPRVINRVQRQEGQDGVHAVDQRELALREVVRVPQGFG